MTKFLFLHVSIQIFCYFFFFFIRSLDVVYSTTQIKASAQNQQHLLPISIYKVFVLKLKFYSFFFPLRQLSDNNKWNKPWLTIQKEFDSVKLLVHSFWGSGSGFSVCSWLISMNIFHCKERRRKKGFNRLFFHRFNRLACFSSRLTWGVEWFRFSFYYFYIHTFITHIKYRPFFLR